MVVPDYSDEAIEGGQFTVKGIHGHHAMNLNSKSHKACYEALQARLSLGRYTLEEAALFVIAQSGECAGQAKTILKKLIDAAQSKTLATYAPGSLIKYTGEQAWHAHEEACWDDLNAWLKANEPRLNCEFPNPNTLPTAAPKQNTATPAPVVSAGASDGEELLPENKLKRNTDTGPVFSMTKAAMIEQHKHEWPSIEGDIRDAANNKLATAKAGPRGWNESAAMAWAKANNKLKSTANPAGSLAQAMHSLSNLPVTRHTLKG